MKQLIYVDNDMLKIAEEDKAHVQRRLRYQFGLDDDYVDTLKTVAELHWMEKDDAYKLFFEGDSVIVAYSMYTFTHLNSAGKFLNYVMAAGRNDIKDRIYIDTSGRLPRDLRHMLDHLRTAEQLTDFLTGMANNKFLTYEEDTNIPGFIKMDYTDRYKPYKLDFTTFAKIKKFLK